MDEATIEIYERDPKRWRERRPLSPDLRRAAVDLDAAAPPGIRLDLGCGVGRLVPHLGRVVGLDASVAMLRLAASAGRPMVAGDLEALPFRSGAATAGFAEASYQHVPAEQLPMALWDLHRALRVGAPVRLSVTPGDGPIPPSRDDDFPGRLFVGWAPERLGDVAVGAGFRDVRVTADGWVILTGVRDRTLADTVTSGMRLLVCGLNPSLHAADAGVGYIGPGNRFWPAVDRVLGDVVRDPVALLRDHGVGMTDLVKRATPAAAELTTGELRAGFERVRRLAAWLRPAAVCFVGLTGYRAAADRRASPGPLPDDVGGCPAYLMPSTSGRNAATSLDELAEHLASALRLGDAAFVPHAE